MAHRHAVSTQSDARTVNGCVATQPKACNNMAHGGVAYIQFCSCGANRTIQFNTGEREAPAWQPSNA